MSRRNLPENTRMSQSMTPKIAVIGAGAVGSLLGGLLACAGHDVTLIGRSAHVEAICDAGLLIDGTAGRFTVRLRAECDLKFKPDLVLLAVKMPDLETTCRRIAPVLRDVPVLTLQNGVRCDEVAGRILGERNSIGAIVLFNAKFLAPGHVTYGSRGALLIGNVFGANGKRVGEIRDLLNRIVPTVISDDLAGARWTKLLWNVLANSMDAMTGESLRTCMKDPGTRRIGMHILKEALYVIEKARIGLSPLPGVPLTALKLAIKSPPAIASRLLEFIARKADTVSSTLQSLRRGRPTEMDYLNGEIVRLGGSMNVATPFNTKVVGLIGEIEKTHEFFSFSSLVKSFSEISHG